MVFDMSTTYDNNTVYAMSLCWLCRFLRPRLDWDPAQVRSWLEGEDLPTLGCSLEAQGVTGNDLCTRDFPWLLERLKGRTVADEDMFLCALLRLRCGCFA